MANKFLTDKVGLGIKYISKSSHGFSLGNVLYYNGSTYALAKADSPTTANVVGIVSEVVNTNNFVLQTNGYISGLSGLTAGATYFLSATTAGALTTTEPNTAGHVSKLLLIADSTTSGYFCNFSGTLISETSLGAYNAHVCNCRLTLTSGVPVTDDVAAATTVYLTPYKGNTVTLYNGSYWIEYNLSEISAIVDSFSAIQSTLNGNTTSGSAVVTTISSTANLYVGQPVTGSNIPADTVILSVDSGTQVTLTQNASSTATVSLSYYYANFDVFLYYSSGLTLEFVAWTNNNTRATAITKQNGVYVKSGTPSKRYIGTIRMSSSTAVTDSPSKRYVSNYVCPVVKLFRNYLYGGSWTYNSTTWRAANNDKARRLQWISGTNDYPIVASLQCMVSCPNNIWASVGLTIDGTGQPDPSWSGIPEFVNSTGAAAAITLEGKFEANMVNEGFHFLQWTERASAATATFFDFISFRFQSGMTGQIWC